MKTKKTMQKSKKVFDLDFARKVKHFIKSSIDIDSVTLDFGMFISESAIINRSFILNTSSSADLANFSSHCVFGHFTGYE